MTDEALTEYFNIARDRFIIVLTKSYFLNPKFSENDFTINFEDGFDVVDDVNHCTFSITLTFNQYETDDGLVKPRPVIFEIRVYKEDLDVVFVVGEDCIQNVSAPNIFRYMYFYSQEVNNV